MIDPHHPNLIVPALNSVHVAPGTGSLPSISRPFAVSCALNPTAADACNALRVAEEAGCWKRSRVAVSCSFILVKNPLATTIIKTWNDLILAPKTHHFINPVVQEIDAWHNED